MKLRLSPFLSRYTRSFMLMPDGAAGGGDGGGGDGGSGGGGGGDAAAAAAAAAAPPASGAADADVMDFVPPSLSEGLAGIVDKLPAAPDPAKPPAKPPEPKPGEKPPEPKSGAKPPAEPPAAQLRKELEGFKLKLAEAEKRLGEGDPRVKEIEAKVAEKEKAITERDAKLKDYETRLALNDPRVTAKLQELDSGYDKSATRFFNSVPEVDQPTLNGLVKKYAALPFNTPEYRAARVAFEKEANAVVGGSDDHEHRKLGTVLDMVERTYEFARDRHTLETEIRGNAFRLQHEAQVADFTKQSEFVKTNLAKAKEIPEGMETTNPYHPKVALAAFAKVLPPEKLAEMDKGIPEFIELALSGTKPRTDADFIGMSPEAVAESQQRESAQREQARAHLVDVAYNGLRTMRIFPTLLAEYQKLRARFDAMGDGAPPDPTKAGGDGGGGGGADDELKNYVPPAIPSATGF